MLIVVMMGKWSADSVLYCVLDTLLKSDEYCCCSVVFGTLVGVFVFSVMWSELLMCAVQIVLNLPIYLFLAAGHADPLNGWRCTSQKRVMSRQIQVRQH